MNLIVTSINDIQNSDFIFKLGTYPKLTLLLTYMSSNMRMSLLAIVVLNFIWGRRKYSLYLIMNNKTIKNQTVGSVIL